MLLPTPAGLQVADLVCSILRSETDYSCSRSPRCSWRPDPLVPRDGTEQNVHQPSWLRFAEGGSGLLVAAVCHRSQPRSTSLYPSQQHGRTPMSAIAFPAPDAVHRGATRRNRGRPRRDAAARMPRRERGRAPRLRDGRAHGLSADAARRRAAAHDRRGLGRHALPARARASRWCRAAPARRSAAAPSRSPTRSWWAWAS